MDQGIARSMVHFLPYNKVNRNEYQWIGEAEKWCVETLLSVLNAPEEAGGFGFATAGSSEAILLACSAWREKCGSDSKGNIIVSSAAHTSWLNAANLLGIEVREVDFLEGESGSSFLQNIDDQTMGVAVTLGTTATGLFEPVREINDFLAAYLAESGKRIPIHVDAASGGFVAPFYYKDLVWDFTLDHVDSINLSGHKYGGVYPSIGWALWKYSSRTSGLPYFDVGYLKGTFKHAGVNFSAPSMYVIAQYLFLNKYGPDELGQMIGRLFKFKAEMESVLLNIPGVTVLSCDQQPRLPVVCWTLKDQTRLDQVCAEMEREGWLVPQSPVSRTSSVSCVRYVMRQHMNESDMYELIYVTQKVVRRIMRGECGEHNG
ncbi:aminotransferase class V-fold PLP-dependent enzyme [Stenotrophomonas maltophilia]